MFILIDTDERDNVKVLAVSIDRQKLQDIVDQKTNIWTKYWQSHKEWVDSLKAEILSWLQDNISHVRIEEARIVFACKASSEKHILCLLTSFVFSTLINYKNKGPKAKELLSLINIPCPIIPTEKPEKPTVDLHNYEIQEAEEI